MTSTSTLPQPLRSVGVLGDRWRRVHAVALRLVVIVVTSRRAARIEGIVHRISTAAAAAAMSAAVAMATILGADVIVHGGSGGVVVGR